MAMKIKTDNKWKNFKSRYEVPAKILKSEFDHHGDDISDLVKDNANYFKFNNSWYHTDMFMRLEGKDPQTKNWDGYHGDSYFSGVLIKLSRDGEQYKVASYIES